MSHEAIIKVNQTDEPGRRARDIAEGIDYACALLHDEYGWEPDRIISMLEDAIETIEWEYGQDG